MANTKPTKEQLELLEQVAQQTAQAVLGDKTIGEGMPELCRQAAREGIVLLKNEGILPLKGTTAVFGRVQNDTFYVGYGSGGDVNAPYSVSILAGMRSAGIPVDEALAAAYAQWCAANPPDEGFWGHWPRYYEEMPLDSDMAAQAASRCETALVILGRAAGEARENSLEEGSYYLTADERAMLALVAAHFKKIAVVLNAGNVMDLGWLEEYPVGAVLYAWQGGMETGNALADILSGKEPPCGKLTDTIAYRYEDYPSANTFLGEEYNNYEEDIFVGYRYFETFAPGCVQFPFGFGLGYTSFALESITTAEKNGSVEATVLVRNTGASAGKEVVQVYYSAPQGKLGKPVRCLAAFAKTGLLLPGESQTLHLAYPVASMASYDDEGVTGHKSAWVLEAGEYGIYVGTDVRSASRQGSVTLAGTQVVQQLAEASAVQPEHAFNRMVCNSEGGRLAPEMRPVPTATRSLKQRILANLPPALTQEGGKDIRFEDVKAGKATLEAFVAQLGLEDFAALARGDLIMDSPLGAKGNAGVLGGVSEALRARGVPPATTTDGPSGIRLQYYASLLPCGTALASSWNTQLVEQLATCHGAEMRLKGSDILLSPGMNIHRNPLCGRNFEYFSEDPLVTGRFAAAVVKGVQANGVAACPKHYACNNQETNRTHNDSRVSERALREIYLRGFEICVKEAKPQQIMTSYNKINGVWGHYNYDLVTTILRGEWGYEGCVMTDWWMRSCTDPDFAALTDSAYRLRAGVDVLMPGGGNLYFDGNTDPDTGIEDSYGKPEGITLGELQRTACHVLRFLLQSSAMER